MLDTRRLEVLVAVADTGSITAASRQLGFTASAVSQNIAALERQTGAVLLEKMGRGIRLTEAGVLLAEHARVILSRLLEAEAALDALRAGQAGHLRLAAFSTAGAGLVPGALAKFRTMHPGVDLDLIVAETDEALTELRAGRIDLAIITSDDLTGVTSDESLESVHILDDPYRVVLPKTHPLARRATVDLSDLSDEPWVSTGSSRCECWATTTEACVRAGFSPRLVIQADEFPTVMGFVAAGLGVSLIPLLALGSVPDNVRVLRVRPEEPVRRVYAVTRRSIARQGAVRSMMTALQNSATRVLDAA